MHPGQSRADRGTLLFWEKQRAQRLCLSLYPLNSFFLFQHVSWGPGGTRGIWNLVPSLQRCMTALTRRELEPGKGAVPRTRDLLACLGFHLGPWDAQVVPAHLPREGNPRELGSRELPWEGRSAWWFFSAHWLESMRAAWHVWWVKSTDSAAGAGLPGPNPGHPLPTESSVNGS